MESNQDWPPAKRCRLEQERNTHAAALRPEDDELQLGERFTRHRSLDGSRTHDDRCERPRPSNHFLSVFCEDGPYEMVGSDSSKYQAPASVLHTPVQPIAKSHETALHRWPPTQYYPSTENKGQTSPDTSTVMVGPYSHIIEWQSPYAARPLLPHGHAQTVQPESLPYVQMTPDQSFLFNESKTTVRHDNDPLACAGFPGGERECLAEEPSASQACELEAGRNTQQQGIVCFGMVRLNFHFKVCRNRSPAHLGRVDLAYHGQVSTIRSFELSAKFCCRNIVL